MLFVVDLETTGLDPQTACVWQIGCAAVAGGRIVSEYETKVRPLPDLFQSPHREVVRRVSGLDDTALLALIDAPPYDEAAYLWWRWTWETCGNPFLRRVTSFNVTFDRLFLERLLCCRTFGEHTVFGGHQELQWQPCIMAAAAQAMGLLPRSDGAYRVRLAVACEHFDIPLNGGHDALIDARAAALLAIRLGME